MTMYGTYHGHDAAPSDGPNFHSSAPPLGSSTFTQVGEDVQEAKTSNWEAEFWVPLAFSLIAGLSTAIGALVVYAIGKSPTPAHMSFSLSLAAGVMITVSVLEFWIPALVGGENFWKFMIATGAGGLCFLAIEKYVFDFTF